MDTETEERIDKELSKFESVKRIGTQNILVTRR